MFFLRDIMDREHCSCQHINREKIGKRWLTSKCFVWYIAVITYHIFLSTKRICWIRSNIPPMCPPDIYQFILRGSFHKLWDSQYGNISLWLIPSIFRKSVADYVAINFSRHAASKKDIKKPYIFVIYWNISLKKKFLYFLFY